MFWLVFLRACKAAKRCLRYTTLVQQHSKGVYARNWPGCSDTTFRSITQDLLFTTFKDFCFFYCLLLLLMFLLCSLFKVLLPCCDVSCSFYAACNLIFLLHCQEWPTFLKGTIMPACPKVSLFPPIPTSYFKPVTIIFPSGLLFALIYLFTSI